VKLRKHFLYLRDKYGIDVWLDVLQPRLGLKISYYILKRPKRGALRDLSQISYLITFKIPYIRSISYTIDGNLFLVLQDPIKSVINISEKYRDFVKSIYRFNFILRSKPLVELLDKVLSNDFLYVATTGLEIALKHRYDFDRDYITKPTKFDGVDLAILDTIENKPDLSMRMLTLLLSQNLGRNFKVPQIWSHVVNHVEKLILGYRVSYIRAPQRSNYITTLITYCKDPVDLCSRAISHPFVSSCVGNTENNLVGISVVGYGGFHEVFVANLSQVLQSYGCEPVVESINSFAIPQYMIVFGVPRPRPAEVRAGFDVEVEYDPSARSWVEEINLDEVVEGIIRLSL